MERQEITFQMKRTAVCAHNYNRIVPNACAASVGWVFNVNVALPWFFLFLFLNYRSTAHPSAEGCIASELGYTTARQPAVESAALCREAAGRAAAALCGPVGELILI